ncbi:type II toxin-antitoxin system RelE/ParE family toxin [Methylobacterium sp. WL7]|nr:type II toxin-antitoxin system RelE/ParE family toxin [Methylobacterium sp. WL7]
MRHRLTRRADADIERILRDTLIAFGPRQVETYAALIDKAVGLVAEFPERPSSKNRPDLAPGLRSFPIAFASGRRQGASHVLYFTVADGPDRTREVVILRVLHDRMDPRLRLTGDRDELTGAESPTA